MDWSVKNSFAETIRFAVKILSKNCWTVQVRIRSLKHDMIPVKVVSVGSWTVQVRIRSLKPPSYKGMPLVEQLKCSYGNEVAIAFIIIRAFAAISLK